MGSANYKKRSRDMAFAFQKAELWSRVSRARENECPREIHPSSIEPVDDKNNNNRKQLNDKGDQRDLERMEFEEKQKTGSFASKRPCSGRRFLEFERTILNLSSLRMGILTSQYLIYIFGRRFKPQLVRCSFVMLATYLFFSFFPFVYPRS